VQTFLSNGLYGKRPWYYFECYQTLPGWLFIKVASWTLEVRWGALRERTRR